MRLFISFLRNTVIKLMRGQRKFLRLELVTIAKRRGASESQKLIAKLTQSNMALFLRSGMSYLFALLLLGSLAFAEPPTTLRQRKPNWRPRVLEHYNEGLPKRLVLYEEGADGEQVPVRQLVFYPSGQIRSEMDLTCVPEGSKAYEMWQGELVPHGVAVSYFTDGAVERIAHYDEGIVHGEVRVFYPNKKLHGIANFDHGVRHGSAVSYYQDGAKAEEMTYDQGKLVGNLMRYYQNEERSAMIPYEDGRVHGVALEWHKNGALKSARRYMKGVLHSEKGNPAIVVHDEERNMVEVQDFQEGQPVGSHIRYYPNGKESYKVRYRDGKKQGFETFYGRDGKLLGEGEYAMGIPKGKHYRYHENGKLAYLALYDDEGALLEPIVHYSAEGQKIVQYQMVNGVREGVYEEWYENGQLKLHHEYAKGEYDGEQREYYESGQQKLAARFKNAKRDGIYREWYDNGNLKVHTSYRDGEKEGKRLVYFENGTLQFDEQFIANDHDGEQREWYENGQLKFQGAFDKGLKIGHHKSFYEDGSPQMEATYIKGDPDGRIRSFYPNGKPKELLHFSRGKRHGKAEEFYESGQRKTVAHYHDDQLDGEVRGWYEDGALRVSKHFCKGTPVGRHREYYPREEGKKGEGQIAHDFLYTKTGDLDGEQHSFYPSGQKQTIVSYDKGELSGLKALWDSNGDLVEEAWYENGKLNGRFFERAKNGKETILHYKNNLREGPSEIYYPPNQYFGRVKAFEAYYVADKAQGMAIEYNEAGQKVSETPYVAGKKEGTATMYNAQGKVIMTVRFKADKENGKCTQFFPNGKLFREVNYVDGCKEGAERTYFNNKAGALAAICYYKGGEKDGEYKEWSPDGVLVFEAEYREGKRHGKFNKYYNSGKPKVMQTFFNDQLNGVKQSYDDQGNVTESLYEMGEKV